MVDYRAQLGAVDPQIILAGNEIGNACMVALGRAPEVVWGWGPNPEHNNKRCVDFMVYGDKAMGQWIANYVKDNAARLGLLHVIWYQQIWSVARASEGWRDMPDRGDSTANHLDHPHVNMDNLDAYVKPNGAADPDPVTPVPGGGAATEAPTPTTGSEQVNNPIRWMQATDAGLLVHYRDGSSEMVAHRGNGRYGAPGRAVASAVSPPSGAGTPGSGQVSSGGGIAVTPGMIQAAVGAVGGSLPATGGTAQEIADQFNNAIAATVPGVLSSRARAACLIGECAQETAGFNYLAEIGGASARYAPYYGRGYIQLTWANNYKAFGEWLAKYGAVSNSATFYNNPDQVATKTWAAYTAIYYFTKSSWNGKTLWEWCDTTSTPWHEVSRAINRGNPNSTLAAYGESLRTQAINAVLAVTPEPEADSGPTNTGPFGDDVPFRLGANYHGYPAGQCTAFAAWRIRQHTRVTNFHNYWHGPNFGNANSWDGAARQTGVPISTTPKAGTVAQSNAGTAGHVAWVTAVNADGTFNVEEYNWAVSEGYGVRKKVRQGTLKGQFENFLDFDAYTGAI